MNKLIGISGRAGAGKDTVASLINEMTGWTYQVKRFSGKLKQVASLLTGIPTDDFERQDIKARSLGTDWTIFDSIPITSGTGTAPKYSREVFTREMTVRELLQKLGTEAVRDRVHENAWVNALFADYWPDSAKWIIPDTRFPNEAQAIKDRGGIIIRVNRDVNIARLHPSETSLDTWPFDFVIDNDKGIHELRYKVFSMLTKIGVIYRKQVEDGKDIRTS